MAKKDLVRFIFFGKRKKKGKIESAPRAPPPQKKIILKTGSLCVYLKVKSKLNKF